MASVFVDVVLCVYYGNTVVCGVGHVWFCLGCVLPSWCFVRALLTITSTILEESRDPYMFSSLAGSCSSRASRKLCLPSISGKNINLKHVLQEIDRLFGYRGRLFGPQEAFPPV